MSSFFTELDLGVSVLARSPVVVSRLFLGASIPVRSPIRSRPTGMRLEYDIRSRRARQSKMHVVTQRMNNFHTRPTTLNVTLLRLTLDHRGLFTIIKVRICQKLFPKKRGVPVEHVQHASHATGRGIICVQTNLSGDVAPRHYEICLSTG